AERYEIVRELGHGGMGVVYLAHDPLLEREVAIKLVPPTSLTKETEERLKQEARLVAKLDHPAIVVVHDIGQHDGSLFFVMPFVGGTNLQSLLHDHALRLGDVLEIGIQVAEALEYAHDLGIVHRDIKPENLMVAAAPPGLRVRITDFGLAIATRRRRLTKSGFAVGTLLYCSPEQVSAEEVDGRSDLYSLGSVLYQCVTGRTPFTGDVQAVLYRIVRENPESPRALGAAIDEELEAIVLGCLEKDKLRRPQTARELKEALVRYRAKLKESDKSRALAEGRETLTTPYRQPLLSALVGREKEFGELQRRLNAALGSECQLVVVSGEAGTGKSRLLAELEELARARDVRVLHGRFVEQDRAFPYQGFCEVLQEYFKTKSGGSSSAIPDFSDLAPELFALFPVLTEIGDVHAVQTGDFRASLETALGLDDRLHVFELLARTMARVVGGKPLVVLLEDLHAADVSAEALGYVIRRLGPAPVLFPATYRTGEVTRQHPLLKVLDSFQGDRRFAQMTLGPFTRSEHRAFLSAIAGGAEVDAAIADQLYQASEGNPYFAKELVLSLLDAGEIVKDGSGALVLSSGELEPSHALPRTIHQAVTRRIERLAAPLQELLSTASVLGRSFAFRDLVLLSGEGKERVDEALERLLADGFLEEERPARGDRLAFVSGVMREVLYAAVPRRQRRKLHRLYAEEVERQNAGRLERVTPQLLTHYAAAGVVEKVLEYGLVFARRSLEAWSAAEAARAARLVLDALEELEAPDAVAEREARCLLASALRHSGDVDGALAEVEKARRLAPDGAEGARVALLGAEIGWQARRVEETRRHLEAGIAAARAAGEVPTLVRLLSLGATVANLRGDHE
ncbi:MAG TPA: protein kinase, partial [Thermoanaerobaculia bacterium]|nr:protein kinase [Thermoanaerobaculia bacterium]